VINRDSSEFIIKLEAEKVYGERSDCHA